jgi:hypothetical protein
MDIRRIGCLPENGSKRHETKVFDSRQGFCDIPAFSVHATGFRGPKFEVPTADLNHGGLDHGPGAHG